MNRSTHNNFMAACLIKKAMACCVVCFVAVILNSCCPHLQLKHFSYVKNWSEFGILEKEHLFSLRFGTLSSEGKSMEKNNVYFSFVVDIPKHDSEYGPGIADTFSAYQIFYNDSTIIIFEPKPAATNDHKFDISSKRDLRKCLQTSDNDSVIPLRYLTPNETQELYNRHIRFTENMPAKFYRTERMNRTYNKINAALTNRKHVTFVKDGIVCYLYNIKPENVELFYNIIYKSIKVIPVKGIIK